MGCVPIDIVLTPISGTLQHIPPPQWAHGLTMQRRSFVKAGALGIVAGGAALTTLSGSAAAADSTLQADTVKAAADDGDIERLYINPTGEISWENFDEEITGIQIVLNSKINGDTAMEEQLNQTLNLGENGGTSGSWGWDGGQEVTLYEGDETNPIDVGEDGATETTVVTVAATATLLNSAGEACDPADVSTINLQWELPVEITNEAATADGDGSLNGGVEA